MAIIRKTADATKKPTPEQIEMLKKMEQMPIEYDEDCPELTKEQLAQFRRVSDMENEEKFKNRKQNVTLRLSPRTIKKAKSLGKGYTGILSRIIERALDNPDIASELMQK